MDVTYTSASIAKLDSGFVVTIFGKREVKLLRPHERVQEVKKAPLRERFEKKIAVESLPDVLKVLTAHFGG